ncbi:hypothetical protein APHAL10511_007517 [Amanita phalloides]|nr:hypothetical protein APHAL10511_007517 [Amanita phalloides]
MSPNAVRVEHDIDIAREQRAIETGSPQDTLPNDVLIHIFVLISQDHGPVVFPMVRNHETPPQLMLSHVCSRWRTLALHTFELWNNVRLIYRHNKRISLLYHEWLLRAGSSPIELSLRFAYSLRDDEAVSKIIQDTVSYFKHQIKTLHAWSVQSVVKLTQYYFTAHREARTQVRLRSVVLAERGCFGIWQMDSDVLLNISLPWSQLQCLRLCFTAQDLAPIFDTLRQMPLLQELHFCVQSHGGLLAPLEEELTIPSLRRICLELSLDDEDSNTVLHNITCPALVEFDIESEWPTYEIIKQQYNLQGLEGLTLLNPTVPASSILKDAPKLQRLWIRGDMLDDEAIAGLSNGTLGCYLRELRISYVRDVNLVLGMVEMRKRTVDRLIENGCNWKELITVLRKVVVHCNCHGYKERVDSLKKVGITIVAA